MTRVGSLLLIALALTVAPTSAEAQFVLRDDTAGWGWLALTPENQAVIQVSYGSPQSGEQGSLDLRALSELRAMGIRRIDSSDAFDPVRNQVIAECAAIDHTPAGSDITVFTLHTEVSFWDFNRLSATEIYEAITLDRIAPTDLATDTYLDVCVAQLASVLTELGFDQG